jgi:hypothetical protein
MIEAEAVYSNCPVLKVGPTTSSMADAKISWIGKYRDFELIGEGANGCRS